MICSLCNTPTRLALDGVLPLCPECCKQKPEQAEAALEQAIRAMEVESPKIEEFPVADDNTQIVGE